MEKGNKCQDSTRQSQAGPDKKQSTGSQLHGSPSRSCWTCGISNNLNGNEDVVLIRDSIPRELDVEEVHSDFEDPFQDLDEEDADGTASFSDLGTK